MPGRPHEVGWMSRYDIVCPSILPCDDPCLPCTQLHLLQWFAQRGHRVLFINPPLRWLADYAQLPRRPAGRAAATAWRQPPRELAPNFWRYTPPPTVPLNRIGERRTFHALLRVNQALYRNGIHGAMARLGMQRPLLWI